MGIIGPGLIGGTLLDQLKDQVYHELPKSFIRNLHNVWGVVDCIL